MPLIGYALSRLARLSRFSLRDQGSELRSWIRQLSAVIGVLLLKHRAMEILPLAGWVAGVPIQAAGPGRLPPSAGWPSR